jgi:phosphatidylglycerophosphatase C
VSRRLALFDLDGTLSRRDTFGPFVLGLLRRHPLRLWRLPLLLTPLATFLLRRDRGELKGSVVHALFAGLSRGSVNAWASVFAERARATLMFNDSMRALQGHIVAGDYTVVLSASPDLYVPAIASVLGTNEVICTELRWDGDVLDGRLLSANRRGTEKSRVLADLRARHPGLPVIAYGNSEPDLDHLRRCEEAVYVNATVREGDLPSTIRVVHWR